MHARHGFITSKGAPVTPMGPAPEVGSKAAAFTALKGDLSQFSLADVFGKVVVINLVPSLDTAVCAAQARRFKTEAAALPEIRKLL